MLNLILGQNAADKKEKMGKKNKTETMEMEKSCSLCCKYLILVS